MARVSGRRIWACVPCPSGRLDHDLAAELADLLAHGVHADAAARDVAGRLRRGEARGEEQLDRAAHVDVRRGVLVDHAEGQGLLGHRLGVDPVAVVADLDDHAAAGVAGGDLDRALARLAGGQPVVGQLEAVVDRVAHEVHERVAERVDHGAVELGLRADQLELDLLAELGREVADQAREAQEDHVDGDHADLHDHRLERLG